MSMSFEVEQAMRKATKELVQTGKLNVVETAGHTIQTPPSEIIQTPPEITSSSLESRTESARYADRQMRQIVQPQISSHEAGQATLNASRTGQSLLVKFDSATEAVREIEKLSADIQSDCPVKTITSAMNDKDREEVMRSNLRLERTIEILEQMKRELQIPIYIPAKSPTAFVSYQDGKPVGCLSMVQESQQAYISFMATHPATKGEGKKLAKRAVQQSEEWGCNGRLKAILSNVTVKEIAEAHGAKIVGSEMIFDPNESKTRTRDTFDLSTMD